MRRVARLNPPLTGFIVEEWKSVVSYGGFYSDYYEVSNLGRVRSLDRYTTMRYKSGKESIRKVKGTIMVLKDNGNGYLIVGIRKDSKRKYPYIHRLVAEAFIPNPENKSDVNHKNGDKYDNRVLNLEWCTKSENMIHAISTGLRLQNGTDNHMAKSVINCRGEVFGTIREAAKRYKVDNSSIVNVCKGKPSYYTAGKYKDGTRIKWQYYTETT